MKSLLRSLGVLVAVAICAASASSPKPRTITTTTTLTASFDDTWSAVLELFAARSWVLLSNDKAAGIIGTDWLRLTDDSHADCGAAPLGTENGTQVRFGVRVKTEGTSTTLTVNAAFQRLRTFDGKATVVDCASKGTIEASIFSDVTSRLKIAAAQRAKQAEEAARAPFYCMQGPGAKFAWCARTEAECASRQAELGEATPCAKSETAVCFIGTNSAGVQTESCHPTAETCAAQRAKVTAPPPQITNAGECS